MIHCCVKQGCELEVQYVCLCLSNETYCCEFHLQMHLKLPNRTHAFDSILTEPSEGSKDTILKFLAKEKSKKEKLKKIILASFKQSLSNPHKVIEESLREVNSDLKEISSLTEKISQFPEKGKTSLKLTMRSRKLDFQASQTLAAALDNILG